MSGNHLKADEVGTIRMNLELGGQGDLGATA